MAIPAMMARRVELEPEADWMGGDLEGVTQMIESGYFTDLGVNALWISPFNTNPTGSYIAADGQHQVSGYHGYWPVEPRQVDPDLVVKRH